MLKSWNKHFTTNYIIRDVCAIYLQHILSVFFHGFKKQKKLVFCSFIARFFLAFSFVSIFTFGVCMHVNMIFCFSCFVVAFFVTFRNIINYYWLRKNGTIKCITDDGSEMERAGPHSFSNYIAVNTWYRKSIVNFWWRFFLFSSALFIFFLFSFFSLSYLTVVDLVWLNLHNVRIRMDAFLFLLRKHI